MSEFKLNPAAFDVSDFLRNDWQKRPRIIRQAFLNFADPISADELAGVALEPGVDSRVISSKDGQWDLQHGPVEDYSYLPDQGWSLLVQAVNEHFPPAQALIEPFRFLPDWRIDDLMVSYSTPGGGVGAHLDQYDVFIIQGQGRRRWQIGSPGDYTTITPHPDLKQIEGFTADIDEVLEPGDMIYIPAGFPHAGESLSECLNYSVGFRAPSQAELLSALADYALDNDALERRFKDSVGDDSSNAKPSGWHLDENALQGFRQLMRDALNDNKVLDEVICQLLSQNPRPPLLVWPEAAVTESGVKRYLQRYPSLQRAVGLRMLTTDVAGQRYGLVQGQRFELTDDSSQQLFTLLLNTHLQIATVSLLELNLSSAALQLLTQFINEGFWFVETEEQA